MDKLKYLFFTALSFISFYLMTFADSSGLANLGGFYIWATQIVILLSVSIGVIALLSPISDKYLADIRDRQKKVSKYWHWFTEVVAVVWVTSLVYYDYVALPILYSITWFIAAVIWQIAKKDEEENEG